MSFTGIITDTQRVKDADLSENTLLLPKTQEAGFSFKRNKLVTAIEEAIPEKLLKKLMIFSLIAIPTAVFYATSNLPDKFNAINSASINVILNNLYVPFYFMALLSCFSEFPKLWKQNHRSLAAGKATLALLSITGALGSSMAAFNGMDKKIKEFTHNIHSPAKRLSLYLFLLFSNIGNLTINTILYFFPIYKGITSRLENCNIEEKKLDIAIDFINTALDNAKHTENPALLEETSKLYEEIINFNNQDSKQRAILVMSIYDEAQTKYPEIYKAYYHNHFRVFKSDAHTSEPSRAYYSIRYLLPRMVNIAVVILAAIALTPPTNAGIKAFSESVFTRKLDITEWGSFFALLPEAYFLGQNVDLAFRLILDCFEKIIHRASNIISKSHETGKYEFSGNNAVSLINIVSILSACAYLAWRSISTIEEQIAAAPIHAHANYESEPISYIMNEAPFLKTAGAIAVTMGAGLANFRAIFTVADKYTNKLRTCVSSAKADKDMKKMDLLGKSLEETATAWLAQVSTPVETDATITPEINV